jgi:hypothetical protein
MKAWAVEDSASLCQHPGQLSWSQLGLVPSAGFSENVAKDSNSPDSEEGEEGG